MQHDKVEPSSRKLNNSITITMNAIFTRFQIPATTTRILLNHFKWDKEKLMERFYDGDQEKMFKDAHVINPFRKPSAVSKPKVVFKL